jgi:hypothetical protein
MASIVLLFIILSSALAAPFDTWNCSPQLSKLTQEWKASVEWIKQDINGLDSSFYASPPDKVGQWVLIRKTQKGIGAAKVDQTGRLEASFEDTNCKPKIKPFTIKRPSENFFTDEALADFIKKNKSGIIYVWSPRMNLSEEGLKEIKKRPPLLANILYWYYYQKTLPEKNIKNCKMRSVLILLDE